jgi:CRP-like cAMP-binding protein
MRYFMSDVDIPENELDAFEEFIHIFRKNEIIMTEGQKDDSSLYLLRKGQVGLFRQINGREECVSEIGAVNFFGEMELINGGPRMATIKPVTDEIIVYKFRQMNLHYVYSNPRLAEKLIKRISRDLKENMEKVVKQDEQIAKMTTEMEDSAYQNALILVALEEMQEINLEQSDKGTNTWYLFDGILHLTRRIMKKKLPDVYNRVRSLRGYDALGRLERDGVITSGMYSFLTHPEERRLAKDQDDETE